MDFLKKQEYLHQILFLYTIEKPFKSFLDAAAVRFTHPWSASGPAGERENVEVNCSQRLPASKRLPASV